MGDKMTTEKKAREFYIDLDDYTEAEIYDETGETISVDAFTARIERPHEDAIHVIEHSAYRDLQRQIAVLGEYARGFKERCDALTAELAACNVEREAERKCITENHDYWRNVADASQKSIEEWHDVVRRKDTELTALKAKLEVAESIINDLTDELDALHIHWPDGVEEKIKQLSAPLTAEEEQLFEQLHKAEITRLKGGGE